MSTTPTCAHDEETLETLMAKEILQPETEIKRAPWVRMKTITCATVTGVLGLAAVVTARSYDPAAISKVNVGAIAQLDDELCADTFRPDWALGRNDWAADSSRACSQALVRCGKTKEESCDEEWAALKCPKSCGKCSPSPSPAPPPAPTVDLSSCPKWAPYAYHINSAWCCAHNEEKNEVPQWERLGNGYCANGVYAFGRPGEAYSLERCKAICESEPDCKFISFYLHVTCSRFTSAAGDCSERPHGQEDHVTYVKHRDVEVSFEEMGPGFCKTQFIGDPHAYAASLETCERACVAEPACLYISLWKGVVCAMFGDTAGDCSDRPHGQSDYVSYAKPVLTPDPDVYNGFGAACDGSAINADGVLSMCCLNDQAVPCADPPCKNHKSVQQ